MILNYILLFIVGFVAGTIATALYARKRLSTLQEDLLDKTLITKLIKEQLPRVNKSYRKRYNGKTKKKKTNSTSR
tara:strand:+ start:662 stop:886 length:225 start_codon:yes stop_codon:yes gene_type:complete